MSKAAEKVAPGYVQIDDSNVKEGHGPVYSVGSVPPSHVSTMFEALQLAVKESPDVNFLGHRPFDANGVAQDFVWETYAQAYRRIENLAAGLIKANLLQVTADNERPLCIYMKNRPEWVLAQYAAQYCGGFPVALYDTLGATSTEYILQQTQSPTVVCTSTELPTLLVTKKAVETLKHVVVVDVDAFSIENTAVAAEVGLKLYTLRVIESIGESHKVAPVLPSPLDYHALIYTRGMTGNPKGVPVTHKAILAAYAGVWERMAYGVSGPAFQKGTIHLSYLPLAHVIEQEVHALVVIAQWTIGFYQGNTLKLTEDLVLLRPKLFVTVPRLLNKIYDKVVNGTRAAGGLKAWLFDWALQTKLANLAYGERTHSIFDQLVFSKVQQKLGLDRCCFIATGSAPLAPDVMNFCRVVFQVPIFEVYGQSETAGGCTSTHASDTVAGTVGLPLVCTQFKLVSVPDMGYNVTDTFHGDDPATGMAVNGRGEICLRGPSVFQGYYKAPDKTAETIDADGWAHTGDIGKNIFKLSQGEYIAPEKIENILVTSPYVVQPFVYGDSLHAVLVAIIVPDEDAITSLARSLNITGHLVAASKKGKLFGFETIKAIKLHPTPFSVESDMMTPTFKLKRDKIIKAFLHEIDALYVECGDLVAGHNLHQG
ncbi:unnamed protein product [Aphanomyces euteiches]